MLLSTVLNLFFIPALYVILQSMLGAFKKNKPRRAGIEMEQNVAR
jgi:hypothetical protein